MLRIFETQNVDREPLSVDRRKKNNQGTFLSFLSCGSQFTVLGLHLQLNTGYTSQWPGFIIPLGSKSFLTFFIKEAVFGSILSMVNCWAGVSPFHIIPPKSRVNRFDSFRAFFVFSMSTLSARLKE